MQVLHKEDHKHPEKVQPSLSKIQKEENIDQRRINKPDSIQNEDTNQNRNCHVNQIEEDLTDQNVKQLPEKVTIDEVKNPNIRNVFDSDSDSE